MTAIELSAPIEVSQGAAQGAIHRALRVMQAEALEGHVCLDVRLTVPHVGEVMELRVPVLIDLQTHTREEPRLPFDLHARNAEQYFPRFHGQLLTTSVSAAKSEVTLRGDYEVPLGLLGSTADKLVLHRYAEESLIRFFAIVVERSQQILKSEAEQRVRSAHEG